MKLNRLYNIDCMEGMKEFPDKFFDLAVVDPPYGIGIGHKVNKKVTIIGGVEEHLAVTVKGESKSARSHLNFITRSMIARHRTEIILQS